MAWTNPAGAVVDSKSNCFLSSVVKHHLQCEDVDLALPCSKLSFCIYKSCLFVYLPSQVQKLAHPK